eukprot:TRINITY_DN13708_c0_g1_i2.p1 TRINITY_DN13708_c0_g1~~TRINITY_DN13708_c0_g1_i2.p1  ORF type:complete len:391 (-),score=56.84 TRINITY_DN13708_c0_g1_i2:47-1189(-)
MAGAESHARRFHDELVGMKRPILLATLSPIPVALLHSIQEHMVSPIWILVLMFGLVLAGVHHSPEAFQEGRWGLVVAVNILCYNVTTMTLMDWHPPLNDLGCTFAASAFLGLFCARNAYEALLYLSLHFMTVLNAKLCQRSEHLVFLLIVDAYYISTAGVRAQAFQSIVHMKTLSDAMSAVALATVRRSLSYWCASVLEVTHDLVIVNSCTNLPAMLGRLSETRGKSLLDYVYAEDVEILNQFSRDLSALQEALAKGELPTDVTEMGALSFRLTDAYGSPVPVHALHAIFGGAGQQLQLLLGITEASVKTRTGPAKGLKFKSVEQLAAETSPTTSTKPSRRDPDRITGAKLLMKDSARTPATSTKEDDASTSLKKPLLFS